MLRKNLLPSSGSIVTDNDESFDDKDYIEHRVSNLDTLAGVAIKYGVEVADIKRANGLATDLHMFGHQILKIPLRRGHAKHSPHRTTRWQETSRPPKINARLLAGPTHLSGSGNKEKKPLSSAMNLLRGYYGLSSPTQTSSAASEGMELTSLRPEGDDFSEDEPLSPMTPRPTSKNDRSPLWKSSSERPMSRLSPQATPESASVLSFGVGGNERGSEPSVRRRSKVDGTSPLIGASEVDMKQDTDPVEESAYTFTNGTEPLGIRTSGFIKALDGALVSGKTKDDSIPKVKKSVSASNLQDQASLQATNSGIARPGIKADVKYGNQVPRSLFEGLPKPALPRYKEALD